MNKSLGERGAVSTGYYQKQWAREMSGNGWEEEADIGNMMQRPFIAQTE